MPAPVSNAPYETDYYHAYMLCNVALSKYKDKITDMTSTDHLFV